MDLFKWYGGGGMIGEVVFDILIGVVCIEYCFNFFFCDNFVVDGFRFKFVFIFWVILGEY